MFLALLGVVACVAGLTHFCLLLLFAATGVTALAQVNVASVLCYVLAASLLHRGWPSAAMMLMGAEIIAHGLMAVAVIGWQSGFYFYIVLIIPVIIVNSLLSPVPKGVLAVGVGLLYLGMDWRWRNATPYMDAPRAVLDALYYFNLTSTLVILGVLSTVYFQLVMNAQKRLRDVARTDPLTQLRNRRYAMEAAQLEAARVQRGAGPLAVLLGDIDHFKVINDTHGHEVGDEALKAVAEVLRGGVREVDHVARWGGEEFLVLLPGTDAGEALAVAERLRAGVHAVSVPAAHGWSMGITLGVSVMVPGETFEQALQRADRALYQGKAAGRNRVVLASTPGISCPQDKAGVL